MARHLSLKMNSELYKCDICEKPFKNKNTFSRHSIKIHGESEIKHACSVCEKSFTKPYILRQHIEKSHEFNSKIYKCNFCGKSHSKESSLKHRRCLSYKVD